MIQKQKSLFNFLKKYKTRFIMWFLFGKNLDFQNVKTQFWNGEINIFHLMRCVSVDNKIQQKN